MGGPTAGDGAEPVHDDHDSDHLDSQPGDVSEDGGPAEEGLLQDAKSSKNLKEPHNFEPFGSHFKAHLYLLAHCHKDHACGL